MQAFGMGGVKVKPGHRTCREMLQQSDTHAVICTIGRLKNHNSVVEAQILVSKSVKFA